MDATNRFRNLYAVFCGVLISVSFLGVIVSLQVDLKFGGHPWKQGDWLINSEHQHVRRSFSGDSILWISDLMNTSPLASVIFLQTLLVTVLIPAMVAFAFKCRRNPALLVLLISPAFIPVFWGADTFGSVRKEMLVYLAFVGLTCLTFLNDFRSLGLIASTILICLAFLSHEGTVFFLPVFILLTSILAKNGRAKKRAAFIAVGVATGASILAIAVAVTGSNVEDHKRVCQPLLERNLTQSICNGAIRALEQNIDDVPLFADQEHQSTKVRDLTVSYILSFASVFFFLLTTNASPRLYGLVVAVGLSFLPLYLLGSDWGRWLNFHFTSVVFLLIVLMLVGKLTMAKEPSLHGILLLTCLGLVWSVGHVEPFGFNGLLMQRVAPTPLATSL